MPAEIMETKMKIKKLILAAAAVVILVVLAFGFKFLVSVGSVNYIYNYMNDTRGSLAPAYNSDALAGANAADAKPTDNTRPELYGVKERTLLNGTEIFSYAREDEINFENSFIESFKNGIGMTTFRGDYHRNLSSVGTTTINSERFGAENWVYNTGKVLKSNGVDYWSGNGWTGQPVVVSWDTQTRQHMNLYEEAKQDENLREVIYPGMDGWIHFMNLETGEETRPSINVGMTFKGSASLYPDGTPLLFCGSGDAQTGPFGENVSQRFYIYSLIDGSLLFEYGYDDENAPRIWHAYDSSPIIDPETDTLIYPGENGVIYTMKLNTSYNKASGSLSINPSGFVEYTFDSDRYNESGLLWGSESSAVVWGHYLFNGDNSGLFYCIDLNTMKMVWAQDLREDVNSSPIFEEDENGNKYIYAATTLKYNYNSHYMGNASIFKLNAMNGEIIWEKPYEVHTVKGLAGGVLSTGALGSGEASGYLFYSVSKTPSLDGGYLVALDKTNGEERWRLELPMYSWSSTVVIYADNGRSYLVQGCQNGDLLLINALTGEILDSKNFGSAIEATPVVYDNRIVFGIRSEKIIGLEVE